LGLIEPVVAAAMAWLLLGQSLTAMQMVGAVVLLGGAALAQIASAERPAPAQPLVP
ncbi:MAG: EamA family transporter, partial [Kutzneria sp.]|nr:EamA family transporter [Kutzneria sp.]